MNLSRNQAFRVRILPVALTLFALIAPLSATWSIVAIDLRTGEVAVASATCLVNTDLQASVPCVLIGKGAGAVQSAGDPTGQLRNIMISGFEQGLSSQAILNLIEASGVGNLEAQQFGIVSFVGPPRTRTGTQNGIAAKGARGSIGTIKYAIQGNVLAGNPVVNECRDAFKDTEGDLSQRVMAAMERAREFGGDGRCSCRANAPTQCGSPPADGFTKSAHVGFIVVGRMGDTDGTCAAAPEGCANGDYWLSLNVIGGLNALDPVLQLRTRYDRFRARKVDKPDGTTSRATPEAQSVPADGKTVTTLTIELRDINGVPLTHGNAAVSVELCAGSTDVSTTPLVNNGDGTYSCAVTAGYQPGEAEFEVVATQGNLRAQLYPNAKLRVDRVSELHCGYDVVTPGRPVTVPLVINAPQAAKLPYLILGSTSGSVPGMDLGGLHLPLNKDVFFARSLGQAGSADFPGTLGLLDVDGRGEGGFRMAGRIHMDLLGTRVDWNAVLIGKQLTVTNVAGFEINDTLALVDPSGPTPVLTDR